MPAVIDLDGSAFEKGFQHGRQAKGKIRAFLDDRLACRDAFPGPDIRLQQFEDELFSLGSEIALEMPDMYREIIGLCEGAGITAGEALLLQTRREMTVPGLVQTARDRRDVAQTGASHVIRQFVDFAADMDDQIEILRIRDSRTRRKCLVMSLTGLLGYVGVNDRGLAIARNLFLDGDWRPGLPPCLAIRRILDSCGSVEEGIAGLRELKLAGSRRFFLCDVSGAACVEFREGSFQVRLIDASAYENHGRDGGFAKADGKRDVAQDVLNACEIVQGVNGDGAGHGRSYAVSGAGHARLNDSGDAITVKAGAIVVLDPANCSLHLRSDAKAMTFDMAGW